MAENNGDGDGDGKITRLHDHMRARETPAKSPVLQRLENARALLPPECPYEPIGYNGDDYYLIDANKQYRQVKPSQLRRNSLISYCDDMRWLAKHYPRFLKGKPVDGFASERAVEHLMLACHAMGFWDENSAIRGRGAWRGEDGDLILHRGDHLWINGRRQPVGRHGDFVYPIGAKLPDLGPKAAKGGLNAGAELLARLDTFAWARGTLDSHLMLGWIGCAQVGGALDFRPAAFITGEFSSGKSTLQFLLECVLGRGGIISVSDTTAAGLWQTFGHDSLPAGVDELEAEAEQGKASRVQAIISLIRQSASGGKVLRGDSKHQRAEFTIRSCFCCSAINIPPMAVQDLSRIVVLNLLPPPDAIALGPHGADSDGEAPVGALARPHFSSDMLELIGAALLRRLADNFRRLVGEVIPLYRQRLQERGFTRRGADLYAALFGAADVALHDKTSLVHLDRWADHRFVHEIVDQMMQYQTPEWRRCIDYLWTRRIDYRVPGAPAIGELVHAVAQDLRSGPRQYRLLGAPGDVDDGENSAAEKAQHQLLSFGLRVERDRDGDGLALLVANLHQGLAELFRFTPWQIQPNSAGGGWSQSLKRMPGATSPSDPVWFRDGIKARAVRLPLDDLVPDRPTEGDPAPAAIAHRPGAVH